MRYVVLAVLILATSTVQAQWWKGVPPEDVWLTQLGFGAHAAFTQHDANFTLPYAPTCCTEYTSAFSLGPALSAFIKQEITKQVRLDLRFTYAPYGATFETDENLLVSGNIPGLSRHTLSTSLAFVGAEFLVDVRLASPFRLMLGAAAGQFIQGNFDQSEVLVQPGTGTFENGARVRNETKNGALQNLASPYVNVIGGLGYDIPLTENHSVILTPEALLSIGTKNIVDDVNWKANQLRIGATVAFALNAPAPPLPIEFRRKEIIDSILIVIAPDAKAYRALGQERIETDTTVENDVVYMTNRVYRTDTVYTLERPVVNASIAARAKEEDGTEKTDFVIQVSTQFITEALPVLPVVFFESQAISLSFRYHQVSAPEQFHIDNITPRTTNVHRDVLNIIGSRMRDASASTITLRGNSDPTTEASSCDLARSRAEAVKKYLTTVWGIDPSRIAIDQRTGSCAPDRTTREPSEAGYSENRRVEIVTTDLQLIAPVAKRRFNEARTINPPALVLDPTGSSSRFVTDWRMEARSDTTLIFARKGEGAPVPVTQVLTTASADMMHDGKPLTVTLHLDAVQGVTADATANLTIRRDTVTSEIERLTLTLFEVSSDELSPIALEQVKRFVGGIPAGSRVIVRGYADLLGNADFNRKLSQRRADAVCKELRKQITVQVTLECTEIASDRFPPGIDSYETPEERFLSRTVQIEIHRRK